MQRLTGMTSWYIKESLNHVSYALSRSNESEIKVSSILGSVVGTKETNFKETDDNWFKSKLLHVKNRQEKIKIGEYVIVNYISINQTLSNQV